ncbi:MAG: diaminopimelate decarboxylase [Chloroflexi bacterium]|nr:diaminopimelate decarboxylase [Chloroflexota bacterium]
MLPTLPAKNVFPHTALVNGQGHLVIGGCDTLDLAADFGTPLYVFDEQTLRDICRAYLREFRARYPKTQVIYAAKAFSNQALTRLLAEEGLGMDVVSGGEMALAKAGGMPLPQVYFHGNNKSPQELADALDWGVGRIVVDSFHELGLLEHLTERAGKTQDILIRVSPGVDPHTHAKIATGILDSKFGFSIATGDAEKAVRQALGSSRLRLLGLHCHIGSQLFEVEPYQEAIRITLSFAAQMREYGLKLAEFGAGGGFGIAYLRGQRPPTIAQYADALVGTLKGGLQDLSLGEPAFVIEPGRSIVGPAGVALYTVGARKEIPGVRTYLSVDGGMGDNIRPALYEAQYEAFVANRMDAPATDVVTIAGKFCESGDVLVKDAALAPSQPGDLIALPAAGAYCIPMASNYNMAPKPAIVMVKDGKARLIRRRETYQDMMAADVG